MRLHNLACISLYTFPSFGVAFSTAPNLVSYNSSQSVNLCNNKFIIHETRKYFHAIFLADKLNLYMSKDTKAKAALIYHYLSVQYCCIKLNGSVCWPILCEHDPLNKSQKYIQCFIHTGRSLFNYLYSNLGPFANFIICIDWKSFV